MEPLFITGRNNVITRDDWTPRQKRVRLVDYCWFRTGLTRGGFGSECNATAKACGPCHPFGGARSSWSREARKGEGK